MKSIQKNKLGFLKKFTKNVKKVDTFIGYF